MSSKSKPSFFQSLKGRMFWSYTLLFGLLLSVTFSMVYRQVNQDVTAKADGELTKLLRHFDLLQYTKKEVELPKWYWEKSTYTLMSDYSRKQEKPPVFAFFDSQGKVLSQSFDIDKKYDFKSHFDQAGSVKSPLFQNVTLYENIPYRMLLIRYKGDKFLVAARSRLGDVEQLTYFRNLLITAAVLMFIGGLGIAWLMVSQATSGLKRTKAIAEKITSDGDYSQKIPLKNEGAEVDELIVSFNHLLEHTEALIEELEQVSNNIAHDLRTPVTRLQALAQTTLLNKNKDISLDDFAAGVLEECELQSDIIETVLTIAGLESTTSAISRESFNPGEMVHKLCQLYEAVAENKGVCLSCSLPEEEIIFHGDRRKLERALANLIDNAVKYTDSGGKVDIILREKKGLHIEVCDTGAGIDIGEQDKIFKRFYRCDSSRSKLGNGLGLSLADAVVRAHGGLLEVTSEKGKGSCFNICLP